MSESQKKATPSAKSKEKGSLLADIDIGDDFLGSWKSMSMAGDGMDFDFGTTTKGKKMDFKFDKMDMDFSLDADFDKLPSFKTDMSDLDISSPIKKSGKSKEKSKEASSGGERAKRDDFAFSFDFNEFPDLDFGSTKKKTDEKCEKSEDKEGSVDVLDKDADALKDDDISSKHPISKADTQMENIKAPDPRNEDEHSKSVTYESSNAEEHEIQTTLSSEKMISSSHEEPTQESRSSEERSYSETQAQKVMQDLSGQSLDNVSEEESGTSVRMVNPSTGSELNSDVRPVNEVVTNRSLLLENPSAHMNSESHKREMCKERDHNVLIGHVDDDNKSKDDSHLESSMKTVKGNLTLGEMVDKRNADSVSKLHMGLLDGGTTTDELVSEKERGNIPTRSKYFKKQNGNEYEKQQASVSSTKLISVGNKRMGTLPNNPPPGKREFGSKSVEFGSKFSGISRPLPNVVSRNIPLQTKNIETGHANVSDNTRECLNADNIKPRNEPMSTTMTHNIGPTKEEHASRERDQNPVHINALRSDVHPSNSVEQSTKDLPQKSLNPGLQATSMKSTCNIGKTVVEKKQISPAKAEMRASQASTLRVSRATEQKLKPLSSMLAKGPPLMGNKEQGLELQEKMVLKRNPSVDTRSQTTSTPTLKRKTFEASVGTPTFTPLKRLSASPYSNNMTPSSEKAVEKQIGNNASMANEKSPRVDVSTLEMEIYSASENDALFQQAEACSKELDVICNMLKKKHEEAKDILVRAIVNNNNLLMLNHPIYQQKISMVQKFAASLSLN
ncbi:uncharacterized protein At4g18490 isoform X1 [Lactuca sativa]|uniref:uncharacterized protein At4g18490 isoform X1 n=1 Tax=Lactuca sativa TaxID=4236 RepID=UPI000CD81C5B|nr:uncharacterized protein At4g18490 isoform X1 [Lactuca sativa]XP_052626292.1 uncharacterized protein At4g18490 isoform X1 [Lactuca sativa]XP_052626293.1 uncharacterized protein At4g18490 isoform X1 [Lactuca sativa]XP_052626294.1 uncharacterized protein At4g18490 isoform X1 [Lactuca sativa]XP_052626295.1 uncharacterized protein At4g18490 isoform X1 [Lactuca sativa]XP_052626296.1 uncharacterized protein At4g18490 isoform X1 [Lactuca sativa]